MPSEQGSRSAVLTALTAGPPAGETGRRFVAGQLQRWGVPPDVISVAVLLTSELMTNAVRHAAPPVCLLVALDEDLVRIEVTDSSTRIPVPARSRPDPLTAGGRGLWLIDTLAAEWGWRIGPDGKIVWCTLVRDAPAA